MLKALWFAILPSFSLFGQIFYHEGQEIFVQTCCQVVMVSVCLCLGNRLLLDVVTLIVDSSYEIEKHHQ